MCIRDRYRRLRLRRLHLEAAHTAPPFPVATQDCMCKIVMCRCLLTCVLQNITLEPPCRTCKSTKNVKFCFAHDGERLCSDLVMSGYMPRGPDLIWYMLANYRTIYLRNRSPGHMALYRLVKVQNRRTLERAAIGFPAAGG